MEVNNFRPLARRCAMIIVCLELHITIVVLLLLVQLLQLLTARCVEPWIAPVRVLAVIMLRCSERLIAVVGGGNGVALLATFSALLVSQIPFLVIEVDELIDLMLLHLPLIVAVSLLHNQHACMVVMVAVIVIVMMVVMMMMVMVVVSLLLLTGTGRAARDDHGVEHG